MRIPLLLTIMAAATAQASPAAPPAAAVSLPLPTRQLTQFPDPSWIENIAVRANGDLILTQLFFAPSATLYTFNPTAPDSVPVPLHTFENTTSLLGIAESANHRDLFVLVGGVNPSNTTKGNFSAWTIDFRSCTGSQKPTISHLTTLPPGLVLPNGVCAVPGRNAILIADSFGGSAWHLDIATGETVQAFSVPEMARPVGSSASTVGINGLKVFRDKLYWTNSGATTIYAMDITPDGFPLSGRVETVVKLDAAFLDDFAVDEKREILWVATNSDNRLFAVDLRSGKAVVAAGGVEQLTLAGDTAAAFGRTERDEGVLYVVTCGGLRQKICGISEGGKVVAVDTKGFRFS